jgi:hypothetical protein
MSESFWLSSREPRAPTMPSVGPALDSRKTRRKEKRTYEYHKYACRTHLTQGKVCGSNKQSTRPRLVGLLQPELSVRAPVGASKRSEGRHPESPARMTATRSAWQCRVAMPMKCLSAPVGGGRDFVPPVLEDMPKPSRAESMAPRAGIARNFSRLDEKRAASIRCDIAMSSSARHTRAALSHLCRDVCGPSKSKYGKLIAA